MRKQIFTLFSIIALLVIPMAPAFADEATPMEDPAAQSATTPTDTSQPQQTASSTEPVMSGISTSTASTPGDGTGNDATSTQADDLQSDERPAVDGSSTRPTLTTFNVQSFAVDASTTATTSASSTTLSIDGSVTLPNGCNAQDSEGQTHVYPESTTTPYLAICALEQAKADGIISTYTLTNASYGVYLSSVDGIAAGPTEYWAVWVNGAYASCGIGCLPLSQGDTLSFVRTDWMTNVEYDRIDIHISALEAAYKNIVVPNICTATTTDGISVTYPEDGTTNKHVTLCGLVDAKDEGLISGFGFQNYPGLGPFLSSVNGITAGSTEFWDVWQNGTESQEGIGTMPLAIGDTLSFRLTDWQAGKEVGQNIDLRVIGFSTVAVTSTTTASTTDTTGGSTGGSTGGTGVDTTANTGLNIPLAFSFLGSLQGSDGSWDDLVTDWAAFAYAVPGAPSAQKSLLTRYLKSASVQVSSVTDAERHALALMALGINPYTGTGTDYISPIVSTFDGSQIGDPKNWRDDIFGIIALTHAGYRANDPIIQKAAASVISQQRADDSWGDVDTTAAAIQALMKAGTGSDAIARGEAYLKSMQQSDGGFLNISSTAWAIQGILALGESPSSWTKGSNTPLSYLGDQQKDDGSLSSTEIDINRRAWEVTFAIPAAKQLTWDKLMSSFSKAVTAPTNNVPTDVPTITATTTATTTLPVPLIATTTVAVIPVATTTAATSSPALPVFIPAAYVPMHGTLKTASVAGAATTTDAGADLTAGVGSASAANGFWSAIAGVLHSFFHFFVSIF